jgi:hypothetical protein
MLVGMEITLLIKFYDTSQDDYLLCSECLPEIKDALETKSSRGDGMCIRILTDIDVHHLT